MDEHGAQGRRVRHHEIGIHVLDPDGVYYAENVQEDLLVVSGECIVVEEEPPRPRRPTCRPRPTASDRASSRGPLAALAARSMSAA
jgi:hypothetical protein